MTQLYQPDTRSEALAREATADAASGVVTRATGGRGESALPGGFVRTMLRNFAVQDWFILAYFALMMAAVSFGSGPGREHSMQLIGLDVAALTVGLTLTRGGILPRGTIASELTYRTTLFLAVFLSYFQLRDILPAVTTRAVDADILAFDLQVFGVEPALAWDRFVTPQTTEWFSFFYFGYFFILVAHVLPMLFNASNRFRIAHFALGIFFVFCTGHLVYMLVPGWGPYRYLDGHFDNALEGGLFWSLVKTTVEAGGAQKDIFPSLHTAAPTYFAIFSYMHRRALPYRYTWPVLAFAATQIIIATMFLRWHYLIDIVAGLVLATTAALASYKIVRWETARRHRRGLPPIFTIFEYPFGEGRRDDDAARSRP
jgi:membrane-associated phospholipid phosphatase